MDIPFEELIQLARVHNQVWPADLVDDLKEEEPSIYQQASIYRELISKRLLEQERSRHEPTLVVSGWDHIEKKGQKNWADFENLLFFYALGKLQLNLDYETTLQKETDLEELRRAIEKFPTLKGKKTESAEKRVNKDTTYLTFGRNFLDSLINNDQHAQHDLNREIQDAEETNGFNAAKLCKTRSIAYRVFHTLRKRYKS